jgi:hypothetical protein
MGGRSHRGRTANHQASPAPHPLLVDVCRAYLAYSAADARYNGQFVEADPGGMAAAGGLKRDARGRLDTLFQRCRLGQWGSKASHAALEILRAQHGMLKKKLAKLQRSVPLQEEQERGAQQPAEQVQPRPTAVSGGGHVPDTRQATLHPDPAAL